MWSVPRCFENGTVAVLASGPSMNADVVHAVRFVGIPSIVVNNTFRLMPDAWCLYGADVEWWQHNLDALEFKGLRVSVGQFKGVSQLKNTGRVGFDPDPQNLRTGGNSGYQAVHLAAHTGAARILLLGFDMSSGHWHATHQSPLRQTHPDTYGVWIKNFETLAVALKARNIEVLNCSKASSLQCFPMADLEDVIESGLPVT